MAISVPKEVLQRGLRNKPISYRRGAPRFGTMRARLAAMQASSSPNAPPPPSLEVLSAPIQTIAGDAITALSLPSLTPTVPQVKITTINSPLPRPNLPVTAVLWDGNGVEISTETFSQNSTVTVTTDENGLAVFDNLKIEKADFYRLGYRCEWETGDIIEFQPNTNDERSTPFAIRPGPVKSISITRQPPSSSIAGEVISLGPQILIYDEYGNITDFYYVNVSLNKGAFSSGTLSKLVLGYDPITFDDLIIDNPDTGYEMIFQVSASGNPTTTSISFDVI